jgi:gelsolin
MPRRPAAKQAKLEDSNVAGIGSKEHKDLKKSVAMTAPEWKGAGEKEGVEIWRIEKFKVNRWPDDKRGDFFKGDAYIVLDTYKLKPDSAKLCYDVHFWLGSGSTQDEQGTAAYKTVELDDKLSGFPTQFRQVEGHESLEFLKLFPTMNLMAGGIESGFNKVKPTEYVTKLFKCHGRKMRSIQVSEVKCEAGSLNDGDAFILDAGLTLWQWNGSKASVWEKRKAMEALLKIHQSRNGKPKKICIESGDEDDDFWKAIGGKGTPQAADDAAVKKMEKKLKELKMDNSSIQFAFAGSSKGPTVDDGELMALPPMTEDEDWHADATRSLYKVVPDEDDDDAEPTFKAIALGGEKVLRSALTSDDVYLLDVKDEDDEHHVYVHVGKDAGKTACQKAITWGVAYLKSFDFEEIHTVVRIVEGQQRRDIGFSKAFDKE